MLAAWSGVPALPAKLGVKLLLESRGSDTLGVGGCALRGCRLGGALSLRTDVLLLGLETGAGCSWQLWEECWGRIPLYNSIFTPAARALSRWVFLELLPSGATPRNARGEAADFLKCILWSHWDRVSSRDEVGKPWTLLSLPRCSHWSVEDLEGCFLSSPR